MPLAAIVALIVLVSLVLLGVAGSLIDAGAERHEEKESNVNHV